MEKPEKDYFELSTHLKTLLDSSPTSAIAEARKIYLDKDTQNCWNLMSLKAATLVNGGELVQQYETIEEGLSLFRKLHEKFPNSANVGYNLANGINSAIKKKLDKEDWLDHQERTREQRAEARQLYWKIIQNPKAESSLQTQASTNLANLLGQNYRLSEAHDIRLLALKSDPENGVAAYCAACDLLWLFNQGICSEITKKEAMMWATVAQKHKDKIIEYAGIQAAQKIEPTIDKLAQPLHRPSHKDPFFSWIERERLTLAPVVELVDADLEKVDWLTLPSILESLDTIGIPPIFAMFNTMKSDFILARDLVWRALTKNQWPATGLFADTLDYAVYGPDISALTLAHRTALDLLDKVAVTANHYFELGEDPANIYFGKLWRIQGKKVAGSGSLSKKVDAIIRTQTCALYGLVELADDYYNANGILRTQKNLRNASTHRFVVLHDETNTLSRYSSEIEHHQLNAFTQDVLHALRVSRSAIQLLALAISQNERFLRQELGERRIGTLTVPDHDWIRGNKDFGESS